MFELKEIAESAWTQELGGIFGKMKLKVKPFLKEAQQKRRKKFWTKVPDPKTRAMVNYFDQGAFLEAYTQETLDLILDWEGVLKKGEPVPFSPDVAKKLINFQDEETGIEKEFDVLDDESKPTGEKITRKALLFEYINLFAGDIKNFEQD